MLGLLPRTVLLPPVSLLILALLGLLIARARPRFGHWLAGLSLAALLLLSLPVVPKLLFAGLESGIALQIPTPGTPNPPQAIVILSGDGSFGGPNAILPGPRLGSLTLERIWAGAVLHERTALPILVSGGLYRPDAPTLADLMAQTLDKSFHTPVRWIEAHSLDTWGNAELSAAMLKPEGITSVYVVSHPWHLRRAQLAFAHFGMTMWPAPLDRDQLARFSVYDFLPSADAWLDSYYALHEWVGCAVYTLRG